MRDQAGSDLVPDVQFAFLGLFVGTIALALAAVLVYAGVALRPAADMTRAA